MPVYSAQTEFGKKYPTDPGKWKQEAFQQMWNVEGLLERNCVLNMMVIGDSDFELDAAKSFKKAAPSFTDKRLALKLVKFKEDPTPEQLIRQLQVLNTRFNYIAAHQKSLSIELEEKKANISLVESCVMPKFLNRTASQAKYPKLK